AVVRVAVEGWFGSVALFVSGIILVIFSGVARTNILPFIFMLLIVSVIFTALTLWAVREYGEQLKQAVRTRFVSGVSLSQPHALRRVWVNNQLHGATPLPVAARLVYLDQVGYPPATGELIALLNSPADDVKLNVLHHLEMHPTPEA